jgi:hypothetical protein
LLIFHRLFSKNKIYEEIVILCPVAEIIIDLVEINWLIFVPFFFVEIERRGSKSKHKQNQKLKNKKCAESSEKSRNVINKICVQGGSWG